MDTILYNSSNWTPIQLTLVEYPKGEPILSKIMSGKQFLNSLSITFQET